MWESVHQQSKEKERERKREVRIQQEELREFAKKEKILKAINVRGE